MMRSMFAGVSGMKAHQQMMDTIGDNIANVNSAGFKASRVMFQDTLSQMMRDGSAGTAGAAGGTNPAQVGLGVKLGAVDAVLVDRPGRGYGDDYTPWLVDAPLGGIVRVRAVDVSEEGVVGVPV